MAATRKTTASKSAIPAQAPAPAIEAKVMSVTPEMAKDLLSPKKNSHNRRLQDRTVKLYARNIETGDWALNGEAIKIAEDGTLLDGQHRLAAVALTGKTVPMLVITGLPLQAQETMDLGRKRNANDSFMLRGERHTTALSAITRRVVLWERNDRGFREPVSFAELSALLEKYPEIRRSAEEAVRVHSMFKFLPISALGTAHHLMSRVAADEVPWFFQRIADGAELTTGDPVLVLRNRAMSDKGAGQRITDVRGMGYIVYAWNKYRAGESITKIQHPVDAQIPDIL